jgi:hypothetical protein
MGEGDEVTTELEPLLSIVDETRSLHRKLAQIAYEVERIPKNGTAPAAMGGFRFVQVGDAADVIRKALADHNVSMIPSAIEMIGEVEHPTSSGKMMTTVTVRTTWTLTDADTGETAVIQSMGSGADMGDKAIPKAQSNAMKYALLMGFMLSTGDDPEMADSSDRQTATATSPVSRPPTAPQAARPAPPRLPPPVAPAPPATPAEALAKTPEQAAAAVAVRRAARVATVPAEPEGLFAPADDGLVASAMALAAEQRAWKEGDVHTPGHKGLIRNARGLFCATKLTDGKWCQWTERSA